MELIITLHLNYLHLLVKFHNFILNPLILSTIFTFHNQSVKHLII